MNCQRCQQRPANVHITQIVNGQKYETFLCEECAQEAKITIEMPQLPIDNMKNLLGFLGQGFLADQRTHQSVCANCKMPYSKVYETGYVGCDKCYDSFAPQLEKLIQKIQGANMHRGKIPHRLGADYRVKRDIEEMKVQLRQAVKKEEYEKAAALRDKIKMLEEQQNQTRRELQ